MARSPLCNTRCSKDKILLRVRILGSIPGGESEIRRRYHRALPRRRYQYVQMTLIHCQTHVFSSLGERLSLDARASDDPQKDSKCTDRILPSCSLPVFGDLPLPFRPGAPLGRSSRFGLHRIPDTKFCKALQVWFHLEGIPLCC